MENNKTKKGRFCLSARTIIIAVAALLLVSITVGLLVYFLRDDEKFDYITSDLSEYISISEDDYKGYTVSAGDDEVTDSTVQRKINALLYGERSARPENNGGEVTTVPVTLGDKAYIYYLVRIENNGIQEVLSPASAMTSYNAYGVGSYKFEPVPIIDRSSDWCVPYAFGFDDALIGVTPSEHKLSSDGVVTDGKVALSDRIAISYVRDGIKMSALTTLDECDSIYGTGMREFLSAAKIGVGSGEITTELSGNVCVYNNIRIDYALRRDNSHSFEITFPMNYADPELRGKTATCEVWFKGTVIYNVPEYDASFITETLGIKEEELSKYQGDDTVARHKAMIRSECLADAENVRELLTEEAVWNHLVNSAEIKKLPREAVESVYNDTYNWIYLVYANRYSTKFTSAEDFAAYYYGLADASLVPSYVVSLAEREVSEKLIFYYISRENGLLPTGDEFTSAYEAAVDEQFEHYVNTSLKAELDALEGEAKEKRKAELRTEMIETLGEEYFAESVYYGVAFPIILDYRNER